jgi:SAM-dependent methyltransferase
MTGPDAHRAADGADPWVARFAHLAPRGRAVLDLACGGGRNGRAFLDAGFGVVFADRDVGGVADLAGRAEAEIAACDLESGDPVFEPPGPLAGRAFGAVVVVNYLHRPLFPALLRMLPPGGVLLYSTFMAGNEAFGKPSNPDFLLRPGELLERMGLEMTVVAFEQGAAARPGGGTAVRQAIAAVKRGG